MGKRKKPASVKRLKELRTSHFLFLTIAGIINAFGVTIFLYPVKLYDSGISGTSMLLDQVTPDHFELSLFLLLLNIPIFLFGLKKQGFSFTVYSIYTIGVYSFMAYLIMEVLPINVEFVSPLAGSDLLLCAIFGGVISGIGSGLTIRFGGAIDGVDVLSVTFAKRLGISLGNFVMIYNTILYIICGIVIDSWILPLYSIITYYVGQNAVDFIVEGLDRSKSVMIITEKAEEVSLALMEAFECGTTKLPAKGGFTNVEKTVIYFVVNRFQIARMKNIVHTIDPAAYLTISEVADVFKSVAPKIAEKEDAQASAVEEIL